MKSPIVGHLKRRISHLEWQSYAILFVIALIIGYGFYISSRGAETTASDIQQVKPQIDQAAVVEAERQKLQLPIVRMQRQLMQAASRLSEVRGATTYLFRMDADAALREISQTKSPNLPVRFNLPATCSSLEITTEYPTELYVAASFLDFGKNLPRLNYAVPSGTEKLDELLETVGRVAEEQCRELARSPAFRNLQAAVTEFDRRIAQIRDDGKPDDSQDTTTSPRNNPRPSSDINVVLLLALNKFGPFVIIFFFSSMLITLYKYNSRLIAFYYARLYAIGSLDGPATTDDLARLVAVFAADRLDYGRPPRTPIDIAGEIANKVAEKLGPPKA